MSDPLTYVILYFVCMAGGFVMGYVVGRIFRAFRSHKTEKVKVPKIESYGQPNYFHRKWGDKIRGWDDKW